MDAADELVIAQKLHRRLNTARPALEDWNAYYEGEQPLSYMHPELLAELEGRIRQLVINWPRLVVDSVDERLDVEGFRLDDDMDARAWDWWQANNLDETSQEAHVDALTMGRSYGIVGTNPEDATVPLITIESPLQVITGHDAATRKVTAAVKSWTDEDSREQFTTLYLPGSTVHYHGTQWEVIGRDDHGMGVVPVRPLVTRPRTLNKAGVSELKDIVPLSDAACKIATDMMVSADFTAIPRTIGMGMTEADFQDAEGRPIGKWEKIAGRIWTIGSPPGEVDVKQLAAADLRNFHETINSLARLCAAMSGLPPHFFGWSDSNPASAEGINAATMRLVKRVERRQRSFGGAYEDLIRIGFRIVDGELPAGAHRLETVWRDASTPSIAQAADALGKFASQLDVPKRALWDRIPTVTKTEVARWKDIADDERTAAADASARAFGVASAPDPELETSDSTASTSDAADTKAMADALGSLIRAGVEPEDAARQVGLEVDFTGAVPVSLRQPRDDAAALEGTP